MMKKNELIQLVITLIGLLAAFAAFISMPPPYKNIFTFIGAGLLLLGAMLYLNNHFGLAYSIKNLHSFKMLGITKVYTRSKTNQMSYYTKQTKTLKIIALSAINLIRFEKDNLIKLLVNCATIQILIADKSSNLLRQLDGGNTSYFKNLQRDIETAETLLTEYYETAKKIAGNNHQIGKLYLGKYDSNYQIPMIIIDDKCGLITLKLPPKKSIESPTLFLTLSDKGLLKDCIAHFDKIWGFVQKENKMIEFG